MFAVPALIGVVGTCLGRAVPQHPATENKQSLRNKVISRLGDETSPFGGVRDRFFWNWLTHLLSWTAVLAQIYLWTSWCAVVYRDDHGLESTIRWRAAVHWSARSLFLQSVVSFALHYWIKTRQVEVTAGMHFVSQIGFLVAVALLCTPDLQHTVTIFAVSIVLGAYHAIQIQDDRRILDLLPAAAQEINREVLKSWLDGTVRTTRVISCFSITLFCWFTATALWAPCIPAAFMLAATLSSAMGKSWHEKPKDPLASQGEEAIALGNYGSMSQGDCGRDSVNNFRTSYNDIELEQMLCQEKE